MCKTALATYPDGSRAEHWADSVYQRLTLDEQIGQMLHLSIQVNAENINDLYDAIINSHPGAITIEEGSPLAIAQLVERLRKNSKLPPKIALSSQHQRFGPSVDSVMYSPNVHTLSMIDGEDMLYKLSRQIAPQYHTFHAAVRADPYFEVEIGTRRSDFRFPVEGVENRKGRWIMKHMMAGLQQSGVASTGSVTIDYDSPKDFAQHIKAELFTDQWLTGFNLQTDLWQVFNQEPSMLMLRGLTGLSADDAVSVRKRIIEPLIYKNLSFRGVLVGVPAAPAAENVEAYANFLKAGADAVLVEDDYEQAFLALRFALDSRFLRSAEMEMKAKNVLKSRYASLAMDTLPLLQNNLMKRLASPQLNAINHQAYAQAIQLLRNYGDLLPIEKLSNVSFASLSIGSSHLSVFQEALEKYAPFVHFIIPDLQHHADELEMLETQLKAFDHVVVDWHLHDAPLSDELVAMLKRLNEETNIVLTTFGDTKMPQQLISLPRQLLAAEDNLYNQRIAPQIIFGALHKESKISPSPYNYPRFARSSTFRDLRRIAYSPPELQAMDGETLNRIDKIAQESVAAGAFPGCQILVVRNGAVVYEKNFGYYTYDSVMPVTDRSLYDLASVTKVVSTTQALMHLYDAGKYRLDEKISTYLPELKGTNKEDLVVSDILTHQSGLRPFFPFWKNTVEMKDNTIQYYTDYPDGLHHNPVAFGMYASEGLKDSLWHWTIDTRLRTKSRYEKEFGYKYSDLGFYLLQMLVERVSGQSLDQYMDSVFYSSLGVSTMTYNPLCRFPMNRMVPTELDNDFRHLLVWGTVHDQIAAMYGGVSGHAGLFSNAQDLAKVLQMNLQGGKYGGIRYIDPETIDLFTRQQSGTSRRGLGWDKPERNEEFSHTSRFASAQTYGHLGFTGTAVWVDPTFNLIYVFLSNRIHPSINNAKLADYNIRKRIHDVIYESIWNFEKYN
jgi:CubicO group peptidase (beta-lactamase class C family)